ncbi:MAG: VWA domain-containing protein [Candidatus Neomarinimicrobiota bacterium]|nr:VWA domain-containing protein [Candidatus Neomarinimicrobiota bacterium]
MIEFRFPNVLFLYIPFFLIVFFDLLRLKKIQLLPNTADNIKNILFENIDIGKAKTRQALVLFSTAILIFAASGPQIGIRLAPVDRKGLDLVFCIDVSSSMRGTDVKPSRLEKSKFEISQMIQNLKGDRVAFIVFAGSSHLYLPLTTDYEAAHLFLDQIDTNMIPTQGTALSSAIQTGLSAFIEDNSKYKVLILITDGEDHEGEAIDLARQASKRDMIVHTVGVGTTSGSLIPEVDNSGIVEYKKDNSGKLITTQLNEKILEEIAHAGKGSYVRFNNKSANYKNILKQIDAMEKRTIKSHIYTDFEEQYQKFGILSLLLMMISMLISTRKK